MKRTLVLIGIALLASLANAGNYSSWAIPTQVELVGNGVLIHGLFGDPNECGKPNYIFVNQDNPAYDSALSIALAALMGQKELRIYASSCTTVSFHWSGEVINENRHGQSFYIK
jgi:hypothetical protein